MVKHVVMFKLTGTPKERRMAADKFADALRKLPNVIDVLLNIEVGVNENPAEDWDLVLTAHLANMEDVKLYAAHPAHVAAAAIIKDCKAARACVDYEV
ncbi:MAG: Dabb family protein [Candidatus Amulumruptor caecigallinarius]|nr:Dabb family protein [Candidatus Amulumruptor caecigallinarius]